MKLITCVKTLFARDRSTIIDLKLNATLMLPSSLTDSAALASGKGWANTNPTTWKTESHKGSSIQTKYQPNNVWHVLELMKKLTFLFFILWHANNNPNSFVWYSFVVKPLNDLRVEVGWGGRQGRDTRLKTKLIYASENGNHIQMNSTELFDVV